MIPAELYEAWEETLEREELVFLASHGGGWPDCLVKGGPLTPQDRLRILRGMGFRIAEEYDMPSSDEWEVREPWARLTNGIGVNLADGYVIRCASGERGRRR